jgi:Domain of unknown function (DUF4383)
MALRLHLPRHTDPQRTDPQRTDPQRTDEEPRGLGARVFAVQRIGAIVLALFLLVFGILGLASGQQFFSTVGRPVLGLTSNGLLSTLSIIVALVLLAAAARGPRIASTVMIVLGSLFFLSGTVNLFVLQTNLNLLAFQLSNVVFSFVVGILLLLIGAYGRISGNLPADSPYAHPQPDTEDHLDDFPSTPEEFAAEQAMRDAEVAVTLRQATPEQYRRVRAMAPMHTPAQRRRVWMDLDGQDRGDAAGRAAAADRSSDADRSSAPGIPAPARETPAPVRDDDHAGTPGSPSLVERVRNSFRRRFEPPRA